MQLLTMLALHPIGQHNLLGAVYALTYLGWSLG